MATVTYNQPLNPYTLGSWYSSGGAHFSYANASAFQLTDGYHSLTYTGAFTYDANGVSGGTLDGMYWATGGNPTFSIAGINTDFNQLLDYSLKGDEQAISEITLQGNDTFIGSNGNDDFYGYAGNDTFIGNGGRDTVYYDTDKASIAVTPTATGFSVATPNKIDSLTSIERVSMGDGSVLALDVHAGENAGVAYRLYQAAFDRSPDQSGLKFWTTLLDNGVGKSQIADGFVNSAEFKTLNPGQDANSLVNSYYQHVLHRNADDAGLQFWSGQMNNGMKAGDVLVAFSESQENIANTAAQLAAGVWLS